MLPPTWLENRPFLPHNIILFSFFILRHRLPLLFFVNASAPPLPPLNRFNHSLSFPEIVLSSLAAYRAKNLTFGSSPRAACRLALEAPVVEVGRVVAGFGGGVAAAVRHAVGLGVSFVGRWACRRAWGELRRSVGRGRLEL